MLRKYYQMIYLIKFKREVNKLVNIIVHQSTYVMESPLPLVSLIQDGTIGIKPVFNHDICMRILTNFKNSKFLIRRKNEENIHWS